MVKTIELLNYLKKYVVFDTLVLENRLNKNRKYTNLVLYRLNKSGWIHKIERNKYTVYEDPFLLASHIIWPAYISGWNALKYYSLTEQVPHNISVLTTKNKKNIKLDNVKIIFKKVRAKILFGYDKIKYDNFWIFIANPEKAIIDSALLRLVSFSEIKEIIINNRKRLRINLMLRYLKMIENKSLIKRFGYLLDSLGKDYYRLLKKFIDTTYVPLDYSKKNIGKKNKKWRVTINA